MKKTGTKGAVRPLTPDETREIVRATMKRSLGALKTQPLKKRKLFASVKLPRGEAAMLRADAHAIAKAAKIKFAEGMTVLIEIAVMLYLCESDRKQGGKLLGIKL